MAPFAFPDLVWDFQLPLVRSINVSGHKYGLVYAGVGWVVWRSKDHLPEELIFHVNYLGADQPTFTLNFSKGASQIIAQYYQFVRLGFEGYKAIIDNCLSNAAFLSESIVKTGRFDILSKAKGVPVVAFSLKNRSHFDEYELSSKLRHTGWIVPAYTMAPDAKDVLLLRIVVREDFSHSLAERFLKDLEAALSDLDYHTQKVVQQIASALGERTQGQVEDKEDAASIPKVKSDKKADVFATILQTQKAVRLWKKSLNRGANGVC